MRVEVVRPSELGAGERARWTALQAGDRAQRGPYFTLDWSELVGSIRGDVRVAVIEDGGETIGFLPFQARSSVALPVGGAMCDYQGLIGRLPEAATLSSVIRAAGLARYDFFHGLAERSEFAGLGRAPHAAWICDVERGFEGYAQDRKAQGSGVLKRTRQKRNKLEREVGPITVEAHSTDQTAFQRLIGWKRAQYVRTGQFDLFSRGWPRELVERAFAMNRGTFGGSMYVLRAGDRLAAVNFCLRSETVVHAWFIAHAPELNDVSPGMILFIDMLQSLADEGRLELDLGYGDQRFKSELATAQRPLIAGFAAGAPVSGAFRAAQYAVRDRFYGLPLGPVAKLPSRALGRYDFMRGLAEPRRRSN